MVSLCCDTRLWGHLNRYFNGFGVLNGNYRCLAWTGDIPNVSSSLALSYMQVLFSHFYPLCFLFSVYTTENEECVFPFFYSGQWYSQCLALSDVSQHPWCATNETYSEGQWGRCACKMIWTRIYGKCYGLVSQYHRGTFYLHVLTLTPAWMMNYNHNELWDYLSISKLQPLKFGSAQVNLSHNLPGMQDSSKNAHIR